MMGSIINLGRSEMPKILIYRGIIFIIFSSDKNEKRIHIHIAKKSVREFIPAKFWLEPVIELSKRGDFSTKELHDIEKIIRRFEKEIRIQLKKFQIGENVKAIKIKK